jgi:DNA-binding NtrC family response regulator
MRALFWQLSRVAQTDEPVCLWGESGTGKDLLATALHEQSPRASSPLVVFACNEVSAELMAERLFGHVRGAFTGASSSRAGLLEQAHGGTLFLDEIGDLPMELQPQLLRALEGKAVQRLGSNARSAADVRLIVATHQNLRHKVARGQFREDLFYRLAAVELAIPPLRERREDVPLLVEHFLSQLSPPRTLSDLPPHALAFLAAHLWPGNVRELKNMVRRLVLLPDLGADVVGALLPTSRDSQKMNGFHDAREAAMAAFEREYLKEALVRHDGNVSAASRELEISRQFMHRLIVRHQLKVRGTDE